MKIVKKDYLPNIVSFLKTPSFTKGVPVNPEMLVSAFYMCSYVQCIYIKCD